MTHPYDTPETAGRIGILLACGRRDMSSSQRARLHQLAGDPALDWNKLLTDAARHGLIPLLAHHLRSSDVVCPRTFSESLGTLEAATARRALRMTGELFGLLGSLRSAAVTAIPYKGPVLAMQLYGSAALRWCADLDLLVSRDQVEAARAVLIGLGYTAQHVVDDGAGFLLRSRYSEQFTHPHRTEVELHWAFTNGDIAFRLGLEQLRARLQSIRLGGMDVAVLGREDLLLVLCVHGAKHRWERAEWLCCVAELVRQAPDLDWTALTGRATSLGVRRMLLLGLLLAHDVLEAPVPDNMLNLARRDRTVIRLAAEVPQILLAPPLPPGALSLPVDRCRYDLRERWRDRLRFGLYRVTTPSRPEEWRFVSLLGRRFPVHWIRRPFRLAAKGIPALLRRSGS
jgi:hypothetical protein